MAEKQLRSIYQINITLNFISPPIWRRLEVDSTTKLSDLHNILQVVMGWTDSHLHMFVKDGVSYGVPDEDYPDDTVAEDDCRINALLKKEKDSFIYEYDFGNGWNHKVVLEKILTFDTKIKLPHCVKGQRNCPPEDVGGPPRYEGFLEAMTDKKHPDHEDMMDWIGGEFDAEEFDPDVVNQILHDDSSSLPGELMSLKREMAPISLETVDKVLKEREKLSPKKIAREMEKFLSKQIEPFRFIHEMTADLPENSDDVLSYLFYCIYRMYEEEYGKIAGRISSNLINACMQETEDFIESLDGMHEAFLERVAKNRLLSQPNVMAFVTGVIHDELMDRKSPCPEEDIGHVFMTIKTLLDVLDKAFSGETDVAADDEKVRQLSFPDDSDYEDEEYDDMDIFDDELGHEYRMDRRFLLAAELYSYSYMNYEDHLDEIPGEGNIRFEKLMPETVDALERAEKEGWTDARLAKAANEDKKMMPELREHFKRAKDIVDAPHAAESFRRAVRYSIGDSVKDKLSKKEIEALVTQICYRAADMALLLDIEEADLAYYSEELREIDDDMDEI